MRGSSFKQIKLSKLNHYKIQKTAHTLRICFARFGQIQLQRWFTGKESIVLESLPAVIVCRYFTASERKICVQKDNKTMQLKLEKLKEKNSDYYYLSNRKMIEVVFSSRVSLLAF